MKIISFFFLSYLPADGRSEYRVQKTHAGSNPGCIFVFEDDVESLVVVGDKGMLHLSLWWPKFGFNISDIRKDFIVVGWLLFNDIEDDEDDDREYVESGDARYNWWSLAPMIKTLRFVLTSIELY